MATMNGASYLREQFSSILNQLHPEEELINSDDKYYIADIYLFVIAFGMFYFLIGSLRPRLFPANKKGISPQKQGRIDCNGLSMSRKEEAYG